MKGTIGINTLCVEKLSLTQNLPNEKAFELIAGMGAKGVDLLEDYIEPHPHPDLYKLKELKKTIHGLGMRVNSCWFYTDPLRATYVSSREKVLSEIREYIAITGFLECKFLILPPGEPSPGMSHQQAQDAFVDFYEELVSTCEEYGVIIGLEVGRMHSPISSPAGALEVVRRMRSKHITICPDWEAWRLHSSTIPDYYAECPEITRDPACSVDVLREVLPFSPFVHAKLFEYDEATGLDPNFPLRDMFDAINESPYEHSFSLEYEGWTPQCFPDRDVLTVSKQLYDMLVRNLQ